MRTAAPVDACCSPVAHACMSVINLTNALTNLAETIYAAASPGPPSPFPHETPTARSRASRSCSATASRSRALVLPRGVPPVGVLEGVVAQAADNERHEEKPEVLT